MLKVTNAQVVYDNVIEAVRDVSFEVRDSQIVALLGSNGAGKSTVLKAISSILYPEDGEVQSGSIEFEGKSLLGLPAEKIVRAGIVQVPEGRQIFDELTVEENLIMGGYTQPQSVAKKNLEKVYDLFPRVAERKNNISGYLSGGEQQMVVVGRALMSDPKILMLDEPSLGLAPQIIDEIFNIVKKLRDDAGVAILLVEQNARLALEVADYGYIMENGRVVMDDEPDKLLANKDVKEFYLGFSEGGTRKNMRDVKHYKRRKRWLS